MAQNKLETVISLVDKTAAPFVLFNKRVHDALKPVDKLRSHLERLGRVSGVRTFRAGLAGVKDSASAAVGGLKKMAMAFAAVGVAGGAAVAVVNKVAASGDDLAKSSRRFGMSVESLQKFRYAANLAGVPIDQMQESMRKLSISSVNAASGVKKDLSAFTALGVKVKDSNGELKSSEQMLLELSDKFANAGLTASQKLFAANEIFGRSGSKMVELMSQGPETLKAQFAELEKYGIMTKEQAEASEVYNDSITRLQKSLNGLAVTFGGALLPSMTKAVQTLTANVEKNKDRWLKSLQPLIDMLPELIEKFVENVPKMINAFVLITKAVSKFVDTFGVKRPLIIAVAGSVVGPLTLIVKSIAQIIWLPIKTVMAFAPALKAVALKCTPILKSFRMFFVRLRPTITKALGPLGLAFTAFEVWKPTIEYIYKHLDMIKNITFDDLIYVVKELNKSFDGLRQTISEIPILGTIARGLGSLASNDVKFDTPANDIGAMMAGDAGAALSKSTLFQSTTKTINKNTNSTIDVRFHDVPKNVDISRRRVDFNDPSIYGLAF